MDRYFTVEFVNEIQKNIENYNQKEIISNNKISLSLSIFERPFGKIFSVLLFGVLCFITYRLITQGQRAFPNKSVFSLAMIYFISLSWIGITVAFYFIKKNHNN